MSSQSWPQVIWGRRSARPLVEDALAEPGVVVVDDVVGDGEHLEGADALGADQTRISPRTVPRVRVSVAITRSSSARRTRTSSNSSPTATSRNTARAVLSDTVRDRVAISSGVRNATVTTLS